jgi:hypothetical protein
MIMRNTIRDPIDDLFEQCKTAKGQLNEAFVRCALASAYSAGYASCLGKLPQSIDGCAVRPPRWPVDEDRVAEIEKQIRAELGKST